MLKILANICVKNAKQYCVKNKKNISGKKFKKSVLKILVIKYNPVENIPKKIFQFILTTCLCFYREDITLKSLRKRVN